MIRTLLATTVLFYAAALSAQTARDQVPAYDAEFGQGINFGWYEGWQDADLARLSSGSLDGTVGGIGVNAYRPGLFSYHLERWGYDILVDEFELYRKLGATENVVIVGYPSEAERGDEYFCSNSRSNLYKGMWEPIWDDNNGTPYNEDNAYAAYLYKAAQIYGDGVRFWEVWNEPDINFSGNGWKPRGMEGNWFDNEIDPCEITIQAPIQAYVRMLRISYEVIKRVQPNDFVAIGGVGFPGFLDAVMRTTDEKESGRVTDEYPYGGGAYFDAISFHVYPHIDGALRKWDNDIQDWAYSRHSDAAVKGVGDKFIEMEEVLAEYGYDGNRFPKKVPLCTESNLPREAFNDDTAEGSSVRMQLNFILKTLAKSQEWGITQFHPYQLADREPAKKADGEFDLMGFYRYIGDIPDHRPEAAQVTQTGIAYRTYGELLRGAEYSRSLTESLDLPANTEAVGFKLPSGKNAFVMWARTMQDNNEWPTVFYEKSGVLNESEYEVATFDHAVTRKRSKLRSGIDLTGTPVFVMQVGSTDDTDTDGEGEEATSGVVTAAELGFEAFPNPTSSFLKVRLPKGADNYSLSVLDATGRVVREAVNATATTTLDVASLPAGSYHVRATGESETVTMPFVRR